MALFSEKAQAVPLLAWILLLGVFVLDTTVTLFLRIRRGETIWQAHRSHYFQRAVQAGCSHRTVTVWTGLLNVLLGALAVAAVACPGLLLPAFGAGILLLTAAGLQVVRMEHKRTDETPAA
jgi:UDP-N-acetylmuramyl pentapeptide phosphotransferase/UDP-N-acetylglucosamine-1-phosphate transferase